MHDRVYLFDVTASDAVIKDAYSEAVIGDLTAHLPDIHKISMTCYRAGGAVAELNIDHAEGHFLLTIWEGRLSVPPVLPDDIRLAHKEISLPDVTDITLFSVRLARYAGLSPSFSADVDSCTLLEFTKQNRNEMNNEAMLPRMNVRGLAVGQALSKLNLLKQESNVQAVYSALSGLNSETLCRTVQEMIISERFFIGNLIDKEVLQDELNETPITIEELRLITSQPIKQFLSFDELAG